MLDINEIEWAISKIEKGESSESNYVVLAALYMIRDRIKGSEYSHSVAPKQDLPRKNQDIHRPKATPVPVARYSQSDGHGLDKEEAFEWAESMKNEDGTTGPHWTLDQAKRVMAERELSGSPIDFWLALCMMYSDYCLVARSLGMEKNMDFYVGLAEAFLNDKDAAKDKLARYYEYVVK